MTFATHDRALALGPRASGFRVVGVERRALGDPAQRRRPEIPVHPSMIGAHRSGHRSNSATEQKLNKALYHDCARLLTLH